MTNYTVAAGTGGTLQLTVTQASQNIAGNTSTDNWSLTLLCSNGASFNSNPVNYSVTINGTVYTGSFTFDFRSYSSKLIASGSTTVAHAADGTKTIAVQGHMDDSGTTALGAGATVNGTFVQTTIPRASKSTFTPSPMVAGSAVTINTNRASTGFTHTITYAFGSQSGTINTGIGASQSWTPPLSLLTEIPNAMSGIGTLTTKTYSGATIIGTTTTSFTLNVPVTLAPSIGSITCSENVSAVTTAVGTYVQGISKLNLAIVGAAGVQGSTIASYKLVVDDQTITAASGVTGVISNSGTRTITATVIDSRGQGAVLSTTISVLAYAPPTIDTAVLSNVRALVAGTPNDSGTYIKTTLKASVSSLINGTEKNALSYRISTRLHGTTTWTVQGSNPFTPGGISFNSSTTTGANLIDIAKSWDILVEVIDKFATTAIQSTIATATIFMHWDASIGVGIGKYRTQGALDVAGDIYANNQLVAGFWVSQNAHTPANIASDFPLGSTTELVNPDPGWPINDYGSLVTVRPYANGPGGTTQYWNPYRNASTELIFFRQWFYQATDWSLWQTASQPAGQITQYAGATAPYGHLFCQGQAISRTTYARLFAVISTTYGVGDGSTTFNIPDLRGRFPVGIDSTDTTMDALGEKGGSKTHNHFTAFSNDGTSLYTGTSANVPRTRTKTSASGFLASAAASRTSREDSTYDEPFSPPFIALNYIIKV